MRNLKGASVGLEPTTAKRVSANKTTMPNMLLSAMCATTYLKAMLTDVI